MSAVRWALVVQAHAYALYRFRLAAAAHYTPERVDSIVYGESRTLRLFMDAEEGK